LPLVLFPLVLASLSDAAVAISRIGKFLTAEELAEPYAIDYERKFAVDVDGDFTWETASKPVDSGHKSMKGSHGKGTSEMKKSEPKSLQESKSKKRYSFRNKNEQQEPVLPTTASKTPSDGTAEGETGKADEKPFELKNLKFKVPKGSFVAIVGRVGSGKVMQYYHNYLRIFNLCAILQSSLLQALIGEMRRTKGDVS
jgi:ATP-binding cassette subfamily C (CFTR/MRP) protein 1